MDADTLSRVRALTPDAARVVAWGLRLEGVLHLIAEHADTHGNKMEKIKTMALNAVLRDDKVQS